MTTLRPYQSDLRTAIYDAWDGGARNVLAALPTGGGKTILFTSILRDHRGPAVAIAHRQELVGQIALALAREGVPHRIIGPEQVIRNVVAVQTIELGRNYYDPRAAVAVAGVDTLVRREPDAWSRSVGLWVIDEGHHVLRENKWGAAAAMFPNARGLAVTATPTRADGRGLGRHADGLVDAMVEGPPMRWLIDNGFLTDYRIFAPPSDVDLARVAIGSTGDYSAPQLREAVHKSHIVGDVVQHYLRLAAGKRGVTFAVDVAAATEQAAAYQAAGVPAEIISAKSPDTVRAAACRRLRSGELLQLVNVDLFGEGFDLPAIEVVSMARPTASYGLFAQQFGRALRPLDGKECAIIIDHVGNVIRHGLPDAPRRWSLDARERRGAGRGDLLIPIRACPECTSAYERILPACPYCGHVPVPASRSSPEQVDGDLHELDPATLAALRGEVESIDGAARIPQGLQGPAARAAYNAHLARQQAQGSLREVIALWGGWRRDQGEDTRVAQRRFFHTFGVDVMTAQTLGAREAGELEREVREVLGKPLPPLSLEDRVAALGGVRRYVVDELVERGLNPRKPEVAEAMRAKGWGPTKWRENGRQGHGWQHESYVEPDAGRVAGLDRARGYLPSELVVIGINTRGDALKKGGWGTRIVSSEGKSMLKWFHESYVDPYSLVFPALDRTRRWTSDDACVAHGLEGGKAGAVRLREYATENGWKRAYWVENGRQVTGWQHESYVDPYSLVFPALDRTRRWTSDDACATQRLGGGLAGAKHLQSYAAENGWKPARWKENGRRVTGWQHESYRPELDPTRAIDSSVNNN